jgi:peptidyl-prolyl cis-trans isomerase SurA
VTQLALALLLSAAITTDDAPGVVGAGAPSPGDARRERDAPAPPSSTPTAAAAEPPATAQAPAAAAAPPAPGRTVLERVAATVNGEVITLGELRERSGEALRAAERLEGAERTRATTLALRRAYDQLVAEKLFRAQAAELQVEVTDAQVDAAIEDIKKRNRFDDATFQRALAENGLTLQSFRAQIKDQFLERRLLDAKMGGRLKVSDEDLQNYYQTHPAAFEGEEERRVRHIFLPLAEDAPAAAVERAEAAAQQVVQRLAAGEDFAAVAKEVSRGPGAEDGGDLGWLRRGTIQKALEDVAFSLADGQVSSVLRAGPGLHLFKVEGRRRGGGRTFEEAKDEIRDVMAQEQAQGYRDQYVAELKRDAVIQVLLPELKE